MKVLFAFYCLTISINLFSQKGSKQKIYSSFIVLNDNLESTRSLLSKQISKQYFDLIKEKGSDSLIVIKSDSLRTKTNDLVNYLSRIKIFLIVKTEDLDKRVVVENDTIIGLEQLNHFDDYFTPTELLIGESLWKAKKGKYTANEISNNITKYTSFIQDFYLNNNDRKIIYINEFWSPNNFYHKPLAGIITQLSQMQLDIRLTEQSAINYLQTK